MLLQCVSSLLGVYLDDELFLALDVVQQLGLILTVKILLDDDLVEALYCIGGRQLESL